MQCRACGTEIADRAIVCFRCGAATMEADAPARRPRRTDAGWWPVVLAALALLAGLSGAVVVFEDPAVRSVTMAGAVAVAALVLLRARRRASTHRSGVD